MTTAERLITVAENVAKVYEAGRKSAKSPEEKDVNFYDYDGTLLYSYTIDEVQNLSELPSLPTQEGLTCQGWNWTLEELKSHADIMDVMPYYATNDGATWYDLENDTGSDISVTFTWRGYGKTVSLDFGDGSAVYQDSTVTGGATATVTHIYAPGKYRAKLSANGVYHLGNANAVSDIAANSCIVLRRVFLPAQSLYLYNYAFKGCVNLEAVAMSDQVYCGGGQLYYGCKQLKAIIIHASSGAVSASLTEGAVRLGVLSFAPNTKTWGGSGTMRSLNRLCLPRGFTSFNGAVNDAEAIARVAVLDDITSIPGNAFLRCYCLSDVTVSEKVTTIGANAFNNCTALMILRFLPTTPPTVANANAFTNIPALCRVEVPAESLETYQSATNYSGIAARMVGV